MRVLYKQLLSYDNVYFVITVKMASKYKEWLGGYEEKMLLLRNGFDFDNISITTTLPASRKQEHLGQFRFVEVKRPLLWLNVASKSTR